MSASKKDTLVTGALLERSMPTIEADASSGEPLPTDPMEGGSTWADLLHKPPVPLVWPPHPFVGLCTGIRHPSLTGRVKIRREVPDANTHLADAERWVPTLHGLSIRVGDRLLLQTVDGHGEPIVVGVIDGFFPRPEAPHHPGPRILLERDEAMSIQSPDGQALLEIVQDEAGPIVRLLGGSARLELPGKLSITAAELELRASKGAVRIEATDEVQVVGETIQLN